MYLELAIALLIMLAILMFITYLCEKLLFPFLEARDERKEAEQKAREQKAREQKASGE